MKVRGSDGSKAEALQHVGVPRLKGEVQESVRGRTPDQVVTTLERVMRSKSN